MTKKQKKETIKKLLTEVLRGSVIMIDEDIDTQLGMNDPFSIIAHVLSVYVDRLEAEAQKAIKKPKVEERTTDNNVLAFNRPKKSDTVH